MGSAGGFFAAPLTSREQLVGSCTIQTSVRAAGRAWLMGGATGWGVTPSPLGRGAGGSCSSCLQISPKSALAGRGGMVSTRGGRVPSRGPRDADGELEGGARGENPRPRPAHSWGSHEAHAIPSVGGSIEQVKSSPHRNRGGGHGVLRAGPAAGRTRGPPRGVSRPRTPAEDSGLPAAARLCCGFFCHLVPAAPGSGSVRELRVGVGGDWGQLPLCLLDRLGSNWGWFVAGVSREDRSDPPSARVGTRAGHRSKGSPVQGLAARPRDGVKSLLPGHARLLGTGLGGTRGSPPTLRTINAGGQPGSSRRFLCGHPPRRPGPWGGCSSGWRCWPGSRRRWPRKVGAAPGDGRGHGAGQVQGGAEAPPAGLEVLEQRWGQQRGHRGRGVTWRKARRRSEHRDLPPRPLSRPPQTSTRRSSSSARTPATPTWC